MMSRSRVTWALLAAFVIVAASAQTTERQVHPGRAYGAAIFTGMTAGALLGAAGATLGYAFERKNQDPQSIILGAVYGAISGSIGLGIPAAAYEIASDKVGAAKRILFNAFGFSLIGGVVGAAGGTISYRRKIGYDENSAEDFLGAAAVGVLAGGMLGLGVGIFEGVLWDERGGSRVPGKGIHAKLGLVELASLPEVAEGSAGFPSLTLARVEF